MQGTGQLEVMVEPALGLGPSFPQAPICRIQAQNVEGYHLSMDGLDQHWERLWVGKESQPLLGKDKCVPTVPK